MISMSDHLLARSIVTALLLASLGCEGETPPPEDPVDEGNRCKALGVAARGVGRVHGAP